MPDDPLTPGRPRPFSLDGRIALVSGASAGLGVTLAVGLADAGADIVLVARRKDGLEATAAAVEAAGRRALVAAADISDTDECAEAVRAAVARFGRLDVLVNNAGTGRVGPALHQPAGEFEQTLDVNLTGAYRMAVAAAPHMPPGSSIINVSSVLAFSTAGIPQAAYAASKAGLLGLTRDLAHQWTGRRGIRVNAIAPGFFGTDMTDGHDARLSDIVAQRIPAGRLGRPEDLLGALLFLASDASAYVTGSTVTVDGGFLIS
jgi:NAD(P)-dependent dehydrogenase (short-subunit alcohol dehydrogenase family)